MSSRTDRVKKQAARPEDFMDEEDLQEMKERMLMSTTDEPRISSNDGALGLDDEYVQLISLLETQNHWSLQALSPQPFKHLPSQRILQELRFSRRWAGAQVKDWGLECL